MEAILEAWNDPQMRHSMLVHAPITLAALGLLGALVNAAAGWKVPSLRWVAFALLAMFAIAAKLAENSGQNAESEVGLLPDEVLRVLHEHEELALNLWMVPAAAAILTAISAFRQKYVRHGAAITAVLVAGFAMFRIGDAAHHGGELVYAHGVGTGQERMVESGPSAEADEEGAETATDPQGAVPVDPRLVHFREQVFPILESNCLRCHNPVRKDRAAGLDQTTMAGILEGGESGPALLPGRPEESHIYQRITEEDEDLRMPPTDPLTPDQIEAIREWIADGAVWIDIDTLESE